MTTFCIYIFYSIHFWIGLRIKVFNSYSTFTFTWVSNQQEDKKFFLIFSLPLSWSERCVLRALWPSQVFRVCELYKAIFTSTLTCPRLCTTAVDHKAFTTQFPVGRCDNVSAVSHTLLFYIFASLYILRLGKLFGCSESLIQGFVTVWVVKWEIWGHPCRCR